MKHAVTEEFNEHLGRSHYQHGDEFKGYRNGYQRTRLDAPMGVVESDRPKLVNATGFTSRYHVRNMRRPESITL